jgi:hypothetical protein
MGKKMEECERGREGGRERERDLRVSVSVWRCARMDVTIPMFGPLCQLDLRLTIPGHDTTPARLVDLRACSPITHSRR